jgi:hypothetical protein
MVLIMNGTPTTGGRIMRFKTISRQAAWLGVAASLAVAPAAAQRSAPLPPIVGPAPLVTLAAPTGATINNDVGGLAFSWLPVVGAIGYQIDAAPTPTGPWTALVSAPVASTGFAHTPVPGVLTYYRIAAVHQLGNPGNPTIVPFIYSPPFAEAAASAAQSGPDLTVTWIPIAGAAGYLVSVSTDSRNEQRQVFNRTTATTFAGLIPAGVHNRSARVGVVALFPRGVAAVTAGKRGSLGSPASEPSLCWPPTGETPGGPAPVGLTATPTENVISLSWTPLGQVVAYRVERASAGSGRWESLACLAASQRPYVDYSVGLQPSTGYDYRVTAVGPGGLTGASTTTIVTPPPSAPAFTASVANTSFNGAPPVKVVRLTWQAGPSYRITTSYGYRGQESSGSWSHELINAPSGTHLVTVSPWYRNGVVGLGTTVPVTVP